MLGIFANVQQATADIILQSGHVDLVAEFNNGWSIFYETEDEGALDIANALIRIDPAGAVVRPVSSEFDFLGAPIDSYVWIVPSSPNPALPWLGISTRSLGLPPATSILWQLMDVVGPGEVSLWSNGVFGAPIVHWSSFDAVTEDDKLLLGSNTHTHLNWGFSKPGSYAVTFQLATEPSTATQQIFANATLRFQAVPEPSTTAIFSIAAAALFRSKRRFLCRK